MGWGGGDVSGVAGGVWGVSVLVVVGCRRAGALLGCRAPAGRSEVVGLAPS